MFGRLIKALIVVLVICLGYWMLHRETIEPQNPGQPIDQTPLEVERQKKEGRKIALDKTEPPAPSSHTEPTRRVKFRVQQGLAVTMEDLILGVPEDEELTEGYALMPIPQYWDKPEIPYVIDDGVPEPRRILDALHHIEKKTGLKFIPYDTQPDAIHFQVGQEHCLSVLGRQGGRQPIRLSSECTWVEVTHEVLHSLGFIHEQSRSDRDQFVKVIWDNIPQKYQSQFELLPSEFLGPDQDTPFSYDSIMLYPSTAFSKDKQSPTLLSLTSTTIAPSRTGLSSEDVERVKKLFNLN